MNIFLSSLLSTLFGAALLIAAPRPSAAQPASLPDPSAAGPALAGAVQGVYDTPPGSGPATNLPGGAAVGNGDLGLVLEGGPDALKFYIGKSDFWGIERGEIVPVGSQTLSIPQLAGAAYHVTQNIGPATLTGSFTGADAHALSLSTWVATDENLAVTTLTNTGTLPLTITSTLRDSYGTTGNAATQGGSGNETWLKVDADSMPLIVGNYGGKPFTGKIAGLRVDNGALSSAVLNTLDSPLAPKALLPWNPNAVSNRSDAVDTNDSHGGSVTLTGDGWQGLNLGVMCLPQKGFTVSGWVETAPSVQDETIFSAVAFNDSGSYPFFRGLLLGVAGGKLSATLNYTTVAAPDLLTTGQWVQVAVEYDVSSLSLYVNGQQVARTTAFPSAEQQMGFDKLAVHIGDPGLPFAGCAPLGIVRQSVQGVQLTVGAGGDLYFTLAPGANATMLLAAVTDRNTPSYLAASENMVQSPPAEIAHLARAHAAWWNAFWSRSYIQIPDPKIQASWYGSLYLLACCSNPSCPPPGLWGNFITDNKMDWKGDYTLDYNYEATFWAAYATNHLTLADNYDGVLLSQMSRGFATAKACSAIDKNQEPRSLASMQAADQAASQPPGPIYSGILYYCHLIPTPAWSDDYGTFWGQKSDALFGAVDMVQRWRYTHDIMYARKVYPYLRGVAQFWDSYLVLQNGRYVSLDDSVDEGSGANVNPATTLSFLRLLYPCLIEISEILHCDSELVATWQDILNRLSTFTIVPASSLGSLNHLSPDLINGKDVIRDSEIGPDFPNPMVERYQDQNTRGSSAGMNQTQAIFPGWSFGQESSPADLAAALNTVDLAAEWYDFNDDCTFYPAAANVGYDPAQILQNLDGLIQTSQTPNFMFHTGGGGTEDFSIVPVTLAAMFVQSYQTNIHVFPNWPSNEDASFGNLNACGGFLVSSAIKNGRVTEVRIISDAGQACHITNPWGASAVTLRTMDGRSTTLSGNLLEFPTQMGESLTLTHV